MAKIFALIPARSGSQRVANKNLVNLNGHPLIAYTVNAAKEAKVFEQIIVSTDSQEIADVAGTYGAVTRKLRNSEMSTSTSPDIEWVNFEMDNLEHEDEDIFVILRPTNPLRKSSTIKTALEIFKENSHVDSLRAMRPVKEHPSKMWRRIENGNEVSAFDSMTNITTGTFNHSSPMQTLEPLLIQDASLEITTAESIKKNKSISGVRVLGFEMPDYEGFDINYPEDLLFIEFLAKQKKISFPKINK